MGKAPSLDAAAQNGVNSSTFSVATWRLKELEAGVSVSVFTAIETRRELARARRWSTIGGCRHLVGVQSLEVLDLILAKMTATRFEAQSIVRNV